MKTPIIFVVYIYYLRSIYTLTLIIHCTLSFCFSSTIFLQLLQVTLGIVAEN